MVRNRVPEPAVRAPSCPGPIGSPPEGRSALRGARLARRVPCRAESHRRGGPAACLDSMTYRAAQMEERDGRLRVQPPGRPGSATGCVRRSRWPVGPADQLPKLSGTPVRASSSQRRSNACQRRSSGSLSSLVDDVHHLRNCRALDAGPSLPHASGDLVVVQDPPILICRVVDASPTQECLDP